MVTNRAGSADSREPLHVRDTGESGLPAVLCLHSLFLDNRMFEGVEREFAGEYRIIAPDFRGQGQSPSVDSAIYTMDDHARDISELMATLDVPELRVIAQSMGGDVAFRLALAQPERIHSMVILGSSARSEPAEKHAWLQRWVDDIAREGFTGETLELTVRIMLGESTRSDPSKAEFVELWRTRIAEGKRSLAPQLAGVNARESMLDELPRLSMPILVIAGEEDIARPPEWSREIVDALPNGSLAIMEGSGHSPILEDPAATLRRIRDFLAT